MKKIIFLFAFIFIIPPTSFSASNSDKSSQKILYWVAPMDPNFRRDKPGKSPMGMDLVPVYAKAEDDKDGIQISPAVEQNLGVRVSPAVRKTLNRMIDTVGFVTADENFIEHIHTYAEGWVKKMHVNSTGEFVKKGQLVLELDSPTLSNIQEEYLLTLRGGNKKLVAASEQKLMSFGFSPAQIKDIRTQKKLQPLVKIYASRDGYVTQLTAREGMYVKPEINLLTIENLAKIWVVAEVFERQTAWVKQGQDAVATFPYLPNQQWKGLVEYVYPQLDKRTHTLRIRMSFANPDLALKPNMYADVSIQAKALNNVLVIPASAVIRTEGGAHVIRALGKGRFKAQKVTIAAQVADDMVIESGLKPGDNVVTSAQFLIDSEASIRASFQRFDANKK